MTTTALVPTGSRAALELAIADLLIAQTIDLYRYGARVRSDVLGVLDDLDAQLVTMLSTERNQLTRRSADGFISISTERIKSAYARIDAIMDAALHGAAEYEAQATFYSLAGTVGNAGAKAPIAMLTDAAVAVIAANVLIEGAPSVDWWLRQRTDAVFRLSSVIRQGVVNGATNYDMLRRLTEAAGPLAMSSRYAEQLAQRSIETAANDARMATFRANDSVVAGVRQISTLDNRTSTTCLAYSNGQWDLNGQPINGTTLPFNGGVPRHRNCRSQLVAVLTPFSELGIDLPDLPAHSTRASMDGQVKADTTMDAWLRRRTEQQVNEQLGTGRAQLWRDKKITLQDLVDGRGRPLTLAQLKARVN